MKSISGDMLLRDRVKKDILGAEDEFEHQWRKLMAVQQVKHTKVERGLLLNPLLLSKERCYGQRNFSGTVADQ